jgi:hypothetical protein
MDGHAALFAAAEAGNLDHLNTALRSGVDVNFVDEVGCERAGLCVWWYHWLRLRPHQRFFRH